MIGEAVLASYEALVATGPGVERKGKTMPYTSVNGHMFSFLGEVQPQHRVRQLAEAEEVTRIAG